MKFLGGTVAAIEHVGGKDLVIDKPHYSYGGILSASSKGLELNV